MMSALSLMPLLIRFPDITDWLTSNASIIHCPVFESAIDKLRRGDSDAVSSEEISVVANLSSTACVSIVDTDKNLKFAERALKRRKHVDVKTQYLDTRFLVPISNMIERLF